MENINIYIKKNFDTLPLSHQNFVQSSIDRYYEGIKGKKMKIYGSFYWDVGRLSKPISSYFR